MNFSMSPSTLPSSTQLALKGQEKFCSTYQVLREVTALALPCLYHGLLSVQKYWSAAGGLSLCTPCACLHQCILSAEEQEGCSSGLVDSSTSLAEALRELGGDRKSVV